MQKFICLVLAVLLIASTAFLLLFRMYALALASAIIAAWLLGQYFEILKGEIVEAVRRGKSNDDG